MFHDANFLDPRNGARLRKRRRRQPHRDCIAHLHDARLLLRAQRRKLPHDFVLLFLDAATPISARLVIFARDRTQGRRAQIDPYLHLGMYSIRRRQAWVVWRKFRPRRLGVVVSGLDGANRQEHNENDDACEAGHGAMLARTCDQRYAFFARVAVLAVARSHVSGAGAVERLASRSLDAGLRRHDGDRPTHVDTPAMTSAGHAHRHPGHDECWPRTSSPQPRRVLDHARRHPGGGRGPASCN
jgi:hypothetical protein